MPAAYPRRFICHNCHTPEEQCQQPSASAEGETTSFTRSGQSEVSGRKKLAQSETSTRTSYPPDAPCASTAPVRLSAYDCTRLTKRRLLLAFLCLLPSSPCLQPSGLQIFSPSQIVLPSPSSISAPPEPSPPSTSEISTAFSVRGSPLPTKSTVSVRLFCPSGETSFRFGL